MKRCWPLLLGLVLSGMFNDVTYGQVNSREGNALVFQINDTEYARISATNGNLGVGTTNPLARIHFGNSVAANASETNMLRFWESIPQSKQFGIGISSGKQNYRADRHAFWVPSATPTEVLTIETNGSVGISNASPIAKLDVTGNVSVTGMIDVGHTAQACATAISGSIRYETTSDTLQVCTSAGWKSLTSASTVDNATVASSTGAIQFNSNNQLAGDTSNLFWDDANNRFGIGTTIPSGVLHTSGSLAIIETGTNRKATIQTLSDLPNVTDDTTYGPSIGFSRETDGTNNIAGLGLYNANNLFVGAYSDIVFGSGAVSTFNNAYERMRIASNGNIGIGTTSPNAKLHISDTAVGNNGPFLQLSSGYSGGYSSGELLFDSYHSSGHDFAVGHGWNAESFSIRDLTASGSPYRVILDGSGNVGIGRAPRTLLDAGTTGSTEQAYLPGSVNIQDWNGSDAAYLNAYDGAGGNMTLMLRTTSTGSVRNAAFFAAAGNMTVYGASTNCVIGSGSGATNCTSDARLKTDIKPIASALEKIASLDGVTFHWKDPEKPQREFVGVIAQNVEKVFPQVVDTVSDTTLGIAKTVDYAALVAPLIEAIKELKTKNDSQAAELKALREELRVHTSEHH